MPPATRLPPNSFFCRELPSAGVFIPHSSVDRIRYSGESPMNQTWARLLHIAQVPPILCFRVGGFSLSKPPGAGHRSIALCVLTPAQDHAQPCVALPAYWLGVYGSLGTLTPARLPHVSVLRIAPRVLRRSLPHPTYEYPAWHASLRLDRMFNRGRDLHPA